MSKSYRHTPIAGQSAGRRGESEKRAKRVANRAMRRHNAVAVGDEIGIRDVSNPFWMWKDGRHFINVDLEQNKGWERK